MFPIFVMDSPSHGSISAEFEVEVCRRGSRRSRVPVVRYRHKKTSKYICFSRKGKVRVTVSFSLQRSNLAPRSRLLRYSNLCQFLALRFSSNELLTRYYANIIIAGVEFAAVSCNITNKTDARQYLQIILSPLHRACWARQGEHIPMISFEFLNLF